MRFFASSHRIHQLAPRTRLLLLGLLGFLALQLLTGIAMHHAGAGWTPTSIAQHYDAPDQESSVDAGKVGDESFDDPFSGLAPPPPPEVDLVHSSLMETAHVHLAIIPLVVFTIAHVFAMTGLGRRRGAGFIGVAAYLAVLGDVGFPFLIRGHSAIWSLPKLVSFLLMIGSLAFMLIWSASSVLASFQKRSHQ